MPKLIRHTGVISNIINNDVIVDIQRFSACASCDSKSACSSFDSQTQQIKCKTNDSNLSIGDTVTLVLEHSFGLYAVVLAFVVPLCLFISTIIVCAEVFGVHEGISALAAFAVIAMYYVTIHLFDYKIGKNINFRIEK